jgi:hypothetical protein
MWQSSNDDKDRLVRLVPCRFSVEVPSINGQICGAEKKFQSLSVPDNVQQRIWRQV